MEKDFTERLENMKLAFAEDPQATIFVRPGKDDMQGRCYMINFVVGSAFWLAKPCVDVTLWQNDDEMQFKNEIVDAFLVLAKQHGFGDAKVLDDTKK